MIKFHITLLKKSTFLLQPLCKLFHLCIKNKIFSSVLKISIVRPIFKSGIKYEIINYRPIYVCPVFSKLFDLILHNNILFQVKNILPIESMVLLLEVRWLLTYAVFLNFLCQMPQQTVIKCINNCYKKYRFVFRKQFVHLNAFKS